MTSRQFKKYVVNLTMEGGLIIFTDEIQACSPSKAVELLVEDHGILYANPVAKGKTTATGASVWCENGITFKFDIGHWKV
jgi:hypothetical protein